MRHQKTPSKVIALALLILLSLGCFSETINYQEILRSEATNNKKYDVKLAQSAIDIMSVVEANRSIYDFCSNQFEQQGYKFDFHFFAWESSNFVEVSSAKSIWETASNIGRDEIRSQWLENQNKFFSRFDGKSKNEIKDICIVFAQNLKDEKLRFDQKMPEESLAMRTYFHENLLNKNAVRDNEMITGCVISTHNEGGKDLKSILKTCKCSISKLIKISSDDDISSLIKDPNKIYEKPWFDEYESRLENCMDKNK
jgi:hypothetical protein